MIEVSVGLVCEPGQGLSGSAWGEDPARFPSRTPGAKNQRVGDIAERVLKALWKRELLGAGCWVCDCPCLEGLLGREICMVRNFSFGE